MLVEAQVVGMGTPGRREAGGGRGGSKGGKARGREGCRCDVSWEASTTVLAVLLVLFPEMVAASAALTLTIHEKQALLEGFHSFGGKQGVGRRLGGLDVDTWVLAAVHGN